jgi:hypothetical protein
LHRTLHWRLPLQEKSLSLSLWSFNYSPITIQGYCKRINPWLTQLSIIECLDNKVQNCLCRGGGLVVLWSVFWISAQLIRVWFLLTAKFFSIIVLY